MGQYLSRHRYGFRRTAVNRTVRRSLSRLSRADTGLCPVARARAGAGREKLDFLEARNPESLSFQADSVSVCGLLDVAVRSVAHALQIAGDQRLHAAVITRRSLAVSRLATVKRCQPALFDNLCGRIHFRQLRLHGRAAARVSSYLQRILSVPRQIQHQSPHEPWPHSMIVSFYFNIIVIFQSITTAI